MVETNPAYGSVYHSLFKCHFGLVGPVVRRIVELDEELVVCQIFGVDGFRVVDGGQLQVVLPAIVLQP